MMVGRAERQYKVGDSSGAETSEAEERDQYAQRDAGPWD